MIAYCVITNSIHFAHDRNQMSIKMDVDRRQPTFEWLLLSKSVRLTVFLGEKLLYGKNSTAMGL